MSFIKILFVAVIYTNSFSVSNFLQNKGIVDIGRKISTSEIEVPKEYVYTDANTTIVDNIIVDYERLQSELFQCQTDFLGTETCTSGEEECPSNEVFTDGYSVVNHTIKTFAKFCPNNTVKIGDKCYLDENENGIRDNKEVVITTVVQLGTRRLGSGDYTYCTKFGGWIDIGAPSGTCNKEEENAALEATNGLKYNYTPRDLAVLNGCFKSDGHNWGGRSIGYSTCPTQETRNVPTTICPTGFTAEDEFCIKLSTCPVNTVEQADGSCKMEYDYYTYHCPTDSNYYQNPWVIRNNGGDCGNPTCVNSSTPPVNNCVRVDYTCPSDPNSKCGKTVATEVDCGAGNVWNNNRCERIESFCGTSTYNANLDICEDITHYTKLCTNVNDVYDVQKNKCVSNTDICTDGIYNTNTRTCTVNFNASCTTAGYTFDIATQTCKDKNLSLCPQNQYNYDANTKACIGEMTMCPTGKVYNSANNKCEIVICGDYNTVVNVNTGKCETSAQCDGTLTNTGSCIPNMN